MKTDVQACPMSAAPVDRPDEIWLMTFWTNEASFRASTLVSGFEHVAS